MYYGKTCSNGSHTLFRKTQSDRQTLALAGNIGIANSSITSDASGADLGFREEGVGVGIGARAKRALENFD